MNFEQFIHNFNTDVQYLIQNLESYNNKLNRQTLSVKFNKPLVDNEQKFKLNCGSKKRKAK